MEIYAGNRSCYQPKAFVELNQNVMYVLILKSQSWGVEYTRRRTKI